MCLPRDSIHERSNTRGLTTFQRSLTIQFGGRMSACSDVPFMLALSWRPGTRHCICQPDRTRAAPSLKEPFICVENRTVRESLFGTENPRTERWYLDPVHHATRTSHSSVDQGTGWDVRTGTQKAARYSAARILIINLPEPLQEALIKFSTILPTVPGKTRPTTRSEQRQPSQHSRTST